MELCGYPAADIALFQHMYKGTFLFLRNPLGNSNVTANVCYLARAAQQGAAPAFNPDHVIALLCGHCCQAVLHMT